MLVLRNCGEKSPDYNADFWVRIFVTQGVPRMLHLEDLIGFNSFSIACFSDN